MCILIASEHSDAYQTGCIVLTYSVADMSPFPKVCRRLLGDTEMYLIFSSELWVALLLISTESMFGGRSVCAFSTSSSSTSCRVAALVLYLVVIASG